MIHWNRLSFFIGLFIFAAVNAGEMELKRASLKKFTTRQLIGSASLAYCAIALLVYNTSESYEYSSENKKSKYQLPFNWWLIFPVKRADKKFEN